MRDKISDFAHRLPAIASISREQKQMRQIVWPKITSDHSLYASARSCINHSPPKGPSPRGYPIATGGRAQGVSPRNKQWIDTAPPLTRRDSRAP